jgi:EAL domain-containing protein (putative c-di-GMP-specific phosphodiesterase class I)/CheY-like chemotaxis protein
MWAADHVGVTTNQTTIPTRRTTSGTTNPSLVLVAEDDTVQRLAITRMIEREGFDVISAETGAGAIALADAHQPDLMIIDAVMPQMSGFEVIAAIRARPGMTTTPAIVVSGLADIESRLNAFAIGADDFMVKPVNRTELVARVRAQLRTVDAWYGRMHSMMSDLRAIRHRISDSEHVATPADAAKSLLPHFPAELGCSTLVTIDAVGRREWASAPFYPEDLADLDLQRVRPRAGGIQLDLGDRRACPLCGAATGSALIATDAGSWDTGRAVLVVGCLERGVADLRVVAEEVADACSVVLSERMRNWESDLELVNWLDDVIERQAFEIVFQPIVDMQSGRVIAQEALARFDDGTAPGQVFRVAVALDRRVALELALVETALRQAVALPDGVRIHVNVSPATALTDRLRDSVAGSSRRIVLEITENALFSSSNADALRGSIPASCLLAADDVGAGYAGLSQLLEYRPDIVKIDRAVVAGIDTDPARQALVAGLVQFAQATRAFVVGEGIERDEEWQTLRTLGVDFGQGYYFARPMSVSEAAQMSHWTQPAAPRPQRRKIRHLIGT